MLLIMSMMSLTTLANELDNLKKVEGGYFISNDNMVSLANYIEQLKTDKQKLQAKVDALNEALKSERKSVESLLQSKDEIIAMQDRQIERLEKAVEEAKPSVFDKANSMLGGAGIASILILFATLQ